ncbi:MAG TPA: ATP synthase subunit I [Bryobacteraceae bacterium]|nr:ATP synthase subunit I [Bryobacteraceae bacterium]
MTAPDDQFFTRATERLTRILIALGVIGTIVAFVLRGWTWGLGFALGAGFSWLNFRWLRRVSEALGGEPAPRRRRRMFGLRHVLLAAGAYAILRYTPISLLAALAGLFVASAAVIVEIIFELLYARD